MILHHTLIYREEVIKNHTNSALEKPTIISNKSLSWTEKVTQCNCCIVQAGRVFRTLSNIYDVAFRAVNYFPKKLYHRSLSG